MIITFLFKLQKCRILHTSHITSYFWVLVVKKNISWNWQKKNKNGDIYFGPFIKDKKHGLGVLEYSPKNIDRAYYAENFDNDQINGYGTMKLRDGDIYVGEFENGQFHGKGTYIWDNGDIYEGCFENGNFNGFGFRHYEDGRRYEGNWKDVKKHGFGLLTFAANDSNDALSYEGYFENDEKSGNGTVKWKSGSKYVGQFKNNIRSGFGTYYYSDGGRYEGNWKDGKQNGLGSYHYSNGERFEGNWKDNKKHGFGLLTFVANNSNKAVSYEGFFENDEKSGNGTVKWKNGDKYVGQYKNNFKSGFGTYYYSNGDR